MKKLLLMILVTSFLTSCASQSAKSEAKLQTPAPEVKEVTQEAPIAEVKAAPVAGGEQEAAVSATKQEAAADIGTRQPAEAVASPAPQPALTDPLNDPNSLLSRRSTYYPFDVSVVQSGDVTLVQAHAKYLKAHPERKVRLEGNCDERGSKKYNRKLGQRRADGVKKMLLESGVMASQVETVSYGEEKPKLACHKEKCWKENRRTDLVYSR